MAGSSSDLRSVDQIWLTAYEVLNCNLPGMPTTPQGVRKNLNKASLDCPSSVRRKMGIQGKAKEYRADLLPIHAQKALLDMLPGSHHGHAFEPTNPPLDLFKQLREASGHKLFSGPDEMADDGLNLLSVLNRFLASSDDFNREELSWALYLAEGLIRAGHALSKTEGGAA